MDKIVVLLDGADEDNDLIALLHTLFPGCEIHGSSMRIEAFKERPIGYPLRFFTMVSKWEEHNVRLRNRR